MKVQANTSQGDLFCVARRVNTAITADWEGRALRWMAARAPAWLTSDQLTLLALLAQFGAAIGYASARYTRASLWFVSFCIAVNWFGDSMDGTLARVRQQTRPRYGFYVDHMIDIFGTVALMCGLSFSGLVHEQIAIALLVGFMLLSVESYLATYTLGHFQLSQGLFGPTEIRLLLILGNLRLLHDPFSTLFGHRVLLFDLGGTVAVVFMAVAAIKLTAQHTIQLYREEPLA